MSDLPAYQMLVTVCPGCDYRMDTATPVQGDSPQPPRPGDLTICMQCGMLLQFDAGMKVQPHDINNVLEPERTQILRVQAHIDSGGYNRRVDKMRARARAWRLMFPDREARIQFNVPPGIEMVALRSEALEAGFISTNEAGLELLRALWPWEVLDEPTVRMVKLALET